MAVPLWYLQEERRLVKTQRKHLDQLTDSEIKTSFGLPWWGANALIEFFEPLSGRSNSSIPIDTRTLTYLTFLRTGTFQSAVGSLSGVSQSSVSRIIESFTSYTLSFAEDTIDFPIGVQDRVKNKLGFYKLSGGKLNGIIGAVDGTHVALIAPKEDEFAYVNRKHYHSINTQVVANYDYSIADVVAKWPGSTHDSLIWKQSSVRDRLRSGQLGDGYFIGDTGYPLEPWLLTAYLGDNLGSHQRKFNKVFRTTRSVVERAIGNWKSRFRSMCKTGGISCYNETTVCRLIVASIVLHNFCVRQEIPLTKDDETFRDTVLIPEQNQFPLEEISAARATTLATLTRDSIAQRL